MSSEQAQASPRSEVVGVPPHLESQSTCRRAPLTFCRGVHEDYYVVEVVGGRRGGRCAGRCRGICRCCCQYFLVLAILFIIIGPWVIVSNCNRPPGVTIVDLSIRNISVFRNPTSYTPVQSSQWPWQVNSDMNITLSMWNRNKVAGCSTTINRMDVTVKYQTSSQDYSISRSEVPLADFSLKPGISRAVSAELKEEHFEPVANGPYEEEVAGPLLEADLRNGTFWLEYVIDTQYLRSLDRKSRWTQKSCSGQVTRESDRLESVLVWFVIRGC